MKKFLILIMFTFIFSLSINTVKAVEGTNTVDITDEWEIYNFYSTYYGMRFDYEIPVTNTYDIEISLDILGYSVIAVGGVDSKIQIMDNTDTVIYTKDLSVLLPTLTGFININVENGFIYSSSYYEVDVDLQDTYRVLLDITQSFSSVSGSYYLEWTENNIIELDYFGYPAKFYYYNGTIFNALYQTQYLEDNQVPSEPSDPSIVPTADSIFNGWIDLNGEFYDFQRPITSDMLDGGDLVLFATYQLLNDTGVVDIVDPVSDIPDRMGDILDIFGMNNSDGFLLFYALLHFLFIGLFIATKRFTGKLPILLSSILITIIFMVFGMLPIYIIIPMIALYIILFGFKITNGGVDNEE